MEELLDILGKSIVKIIKKEMAKPRPRFTKRGDMPKGRYNFIGTGKLRDSVEYKIVEGETILIIMEDYGVEYVFSDLAETFGLEGGSFPGGGAYYPDRRKPEQKAKFSPLIASLTKWAQAKFQVPPAEAKNIAFATRTSLFKAGYKGLPLFTDEVNNLILEELNKLVSDERFANEMVDDILDRINILGTNTYNLTIG